MWWKKLVKLISTVKQPKARASIIWAIGEYCSVVEIYAPDILRELAKNFKIEESQVKIQILNLEVKLLLYFSSSSLDSVIYKKK